MAGEAGARTRLNASRNTYETCITTAWLLGEMRFSCFSGVSEVYANYLRKLCGMCGIFLDYFTLPQRLPFETRRSAPRPSRAQTWGSGTGTIEMVSRAGMVPLGF